MQIVLRGYFLGAYKLDIRELAMPDHLIMPILDSQDP
jgi:hypothetical protein